MNLYFWQDFFSLWGILMVLLFLVVFFLLFLDMVASHKRWNQRHQSDHPRLTHSAYTGLLNYGPW